MGKINILRWSVLLSFSTDTRSKSSLPLDSSLIKNRLLKTAPDINELLFQYHTMDLSVVDTMLRNTQDLNS